MTALYPESMKMEARRLHSEGLNITKTAEKLGIHRNIVGRWVANPHESYIDEVALMRALEGDRKVYQNLTISERKEFYRRAYRKSQASYYEAREYLDDSRELNPWLHFMSDCLGVKEDTLYRSMRRASK